MHNPPCTSQPCQRLSVKKLFISSKNENLSLHCINIGSNNPNRESLHIILVNNGKVAHPHFKVTFTEIAETLNM